MNPKVTNDASVVDALLRNNAEYAKLFTGPVPGAPSLRTAIVACMDARLDVFGVLGLALGQSHIIRNAGGVVTDDVMRSLLISQRFLGTVEIVLIHHTDCGMLKFTDEALAAELAAETGSAPTYPFHAFDDIEVDIRAGMTRIRDDRHLPHRDRVRGFNYDIATGKLREVV